MRLKGKVAIVTGGAHGMGASECKLFASEGAQVTIADLREEDGRKIEAEISETGGEAMFVQMDVTSEQDWTRTISQTVTRFGKLDILINNAGVTGSALTSDLLDLDAWDRLMEVNSRSIFLGLKAALPELRKGDGGSVVNISSVAGIVGLDFTHPGYNASKGAVRILTKTAAVQYAREGIRFNAVFPGMLPPMLNQSQGFIQQRQEMLDTIPMGREGRQVEVANAVLFLASDEASYITGAEIAVDGGFTAR